jgi:cytochrome P450
MPGLALPASGVDLFTDEMLTDPYPAYAKLRAAGPAVWLRRYGAWAIPRYAEASEVLRDHETFSSAPNPGLEPDRPDLPKGGVLGSDPPDHTRMRSILNENLSSRAMRTLRGDLEQRADRLVAGILPRRSFDAVADLARRFPLEVVADLVGLPPEGRENLLVLADAGFDSFGPSNARTLAALPGVPAIFGYVASSMSRENIAPGSWGAAVYEAVDRGVIAEEEAVHLLLGYLVAGMDTTINAISSTIWLLIRHPSVWAALRGDPALARPVLAEALRLESPVSFFCRGATRDTTIGGVPITRGDRVIVLFGSANRDERQYPDPDRFDIERNPVDHLAFGSGVHSCAGQALARLGANAILAALARRVQTIRLAGEPVRHLNNTVRGLESLPVTVEPA